MADTTTNSSIEEAIKNSDWSTICAALMPHFNDYLARRSKNIFECALATSLEHISTVPALFDDGAGTRKQVIVPMKLFTKDADAAVEKTKEATKAANAAAETANTAAANADKARADLETKKKEVDEAVSASKTQTDAAKKATADTLAAKTDIEKNETARQTAETARVKAEDVRANAETARGDAEKKRVSAETARANAETTRGKSETTRQAQETTRQAQETTRQSQETARVEAEKKRVAAESARVTAESSRASAEQKRETDIKTTIASSKTQTDLAKELNEHPTKMGDNGNWWRWNVETKEYEDTGIIARGGMMYPSFQQRRNKLLLVDNSSNVGNHVVRRRNKLIIKV